MTSNLVMSAFAAVLGACIGSFLNVVIFRLPRGLSVGQPRRSFCPGCGHTIAGFDNIPVLSFLLLRGRCRHCRATISMQYPLVELATSLLFVATFDVLIVQRWRTGVGAWPQDGAIVAAHWILWAGLLATAVMDIEAYYLDVRITWAVAAAGVACHVLWTPESSQGWIRPGASTAVGAIAATAALVVTALCTIGRSRPDDGTGVEPQPAESAPADASAVPGADTAAVPGKPSLRSRTATAAALLTIAIGLALVVGYIVWMNGAPGSVRPGRLSPAALRFALVVGTMMAMTILISSAPRAADHEIMEAIQAESVSARRMALGEALWLAPAIVAGIGAAVLWSRMFPAGAEGAGAWLNWAPVGQWRPWLGLATGLSGWLIAGLIGWAVRVVFTMLLGKEALGTGDIHILAAAGAVAGWPVVVLGFFLSAPLALVGVLFFALRRSSRAIQYGPWLGLGFFVAAAAQDRIIEYLRVGLIL